MACLALSVCSWGHGGLCWGCYASCVMWEIDGARVSGLIDGLDRYPISCSQIVWSSVTIPAITPTFSSPSRPTASPEVLRDISSSHVPLGSHVIHPRAPSSRPMPRDPVSRPRWVRLRESPPSTPDAPDEPESSTDPRIDSAALTEDLSILQGLLSGLPMSLWSTVMDIDGH